MFNIGTLYLYTYMKRKKYRIKQLYNIQINRIRISNVIICLPNDNVRSSSIRINDPSQINVISIEDINIAWTTVNNMQKESCKNRLATGALSIMIMMLLQRPTFVCVCAIKLYYVYMIIIQRSLYIIIRLKLVPISCKTSSRQHLLQYK